MPTETPPPTINTFAIPVTVTYWVPIFGQPQQPQPQPQPNAQPSPQPSQPSQPSQPTQPQQAFIHPFQLMMQSMMNSMMQPTPPNSPSHQQQQPTNIPLPVLLNMMWSLQGGISQGITPEMMSQFMQGGGNKPPPITATKIIDELSKHTFHESSTIITPSMTTCSVCQDDFTDGDIWTSLPCQHPYHMDCITPWLKQHHTCPSCRYPLETDDSEYNQRIVFPTQRTWKHTSNNKSTSSTPETTCCMSHIHHSSCTLLSGNSSQVALNCHHTYHLECLHTAQRVLSNSSSSSHGEQIVTCPLCHATQSFPVHLSHLIQATTPTSTPSTSTPTPQPMMSPKEGLSPKDIDIPFEFPTTASSTITSSPQSTSAASSQVPTITSLNGTATIQDDLEMSDA